MAILHQRIVHFKNIMKKLHSAIFFVVFRIPIFSFTSFIFNKSQKDKKLYETPDNDISENTWLSVIFDGRVYQLSRQHLWRISEI